MINTVIALDRSGVNLMLPNTVASLFHAICLRKAPQTNFSEEPPQHPLKRPEISYFSYQKYYYNLNITMVKTSDILGVEGKNYH